MTMDEIVSEELVTRVAEIVAAIGAELSPTDPKLQKALTPLGPINRRKIWLSRFRRRRKGLP